MAGSRSSSRRNAEAAGSKQLPRYTHRSERPRDDTTCCKSAMVILARLVVYVGLGSILVVWLLQQMSGEPMRELQALYGLGEDSKPVATIHRMEVNKAREELKAMTDHLERFKELVESTTVPRDSFDKLKEKALEVSSDLIRARAESSQYRSDALKLKERGMELNSKGTSEIAKLNATYASIFKKGSDQLSKLKSQVKQYETANENLEKQLASATLKLEKASEQLPDTKALARANERAETAEATLKTSQMNFEALEANYLQASNALNKSQTKLELVQKELVAMREENSFLKEKQTASAKNVSQVTPKQEVTGGDTPLLKPDSDKEGSFAGAGVTPHADSAGAEDRCLRKIRELATKSATLETTLSNTKQERDVCEKEIERLKGVSKELERASQSLREEKALLLKDLERAQQVPKARSDDAFSSLGFGSSNPEVPIHNLQQQQNQQNYPSGASQPNFGNQFGNQALQNQQQQHTYNSQQDRLGQQFGTSNYQYQQQQQQQQQQYALPQAGGQQFGGYPNNVGDVLENAQPPMTNQGQANQYVAAQPCQGQRKFEFNSDRPGLYYSSVPVDSARRCREICQQDVRCVTWVYVKSLADCYLKSEVQAAVQNPCCVSGLKCA